MIRNRRPMPVLLAFLLGICFLGPPQQARAGLQVSLAEGGYASMNVSVSTLTDGTQVAVFNGGYGDFLFDSLTVTSTSGVTASDPRGSMLQDVELSIRRSSATTGNGILTLTISDNGFTSPGAPNTGVTLYSSLTNQIMTNATVSTFHSSLDGTSDPLLTLTGLGAVAEATNVTRGSGSTFTLGNVMTITVGSGGTAQITGLTTVAPAPAGLALALTGLPFLGLGCWRRWHPKKRKGL